MTLSMSSYCSYFDYMRDAIFTPDKLSGQQYCIVQLGKGYGDGLYITGTVEYPFPCSTFIILVYLRVGRDYTSIYSCLTTIYLDAEYRYPPGWSYSDYNNRHGIALTPHSEYMDWEWSQTTPNTQTSDGMYICCMQ